MPLFSSSRDARSRDARAEAARERLGLLAARAQDPPPAEWLVDPGPVVGEGAGGSDATEQLREFPPRSGTGLVPAALRGARWDPGRRGVVVLAVVGFVACCVAAWTAWNARPRTEPVPRNAVAIASTSPAAPQLVVAVSGLVRHPGLVRLPAGARVADAIQGAGGFAPGGVVGGLNLARKLADGELVTVGGPATTAAAGAGPSQGSLLDLNTASASDLESLPGVGPVLAQRILDYRTGHGGFRSVDQLREVGGIGESKFQQLKPRVTV